VAAESAPAQMHELLDALGPVIALARRIGMGSTIILTVDKHGNVQPPKITSTGDVAKTKP
jgi:hypothetical protein